MKASLPASLLCAATITLSTIAFSPAFAATTNIVADTAVAPLTRSAWLREVLPDNAILYARVPSLWTTLSYKEDSFKYALGNEQHLKVVKDLQKSTEKWVQQADPEISPLLTLLAGQMDGPVELVAIPSSPMPQVLLSAQLNFSSTAQLQTLIDTLISADVIRGEAQKMENGSGILLTDAGPTPYRWDAENKRLNLLLGFGGADLTALDNAFSSLKKNPDSPMLSNEQQMDDSHQGLYIWFNNQVALPMYQAMAPKHIMQQLQMFGVPEMKSLALSWGVQQGKGRLKLQLDAPNKGMIRQMLPISNNDLSIATAGAPDLSVLTNIPSASQFTQIEQLVISMNGKSKDYDAFKQGFKTKLGFSIEDLLDAIGSELVGIVDDAGEYVALRIRDRAKFDAILAKIVEQPNALKEVKSINGVETTHVRFPGFITEEQMEDAKDVPFFIQDLLTKVSTHTYWQIEGDYLIIADLPQVLIDRQALLNDNNLATWLSETQKQDLSNSSIAISGSIDQAPRRLYYGYLTAIQALSDVTDGSIDIFSLPTATQLNLPDEGTFGFQFDSGVDKLGLEFTFESTPADILLSSKGLSTMAVAGIVAAVAVPAYEDYGFKVKTAAGYADGLTATDKLSEFYTANQRFPNAEETAAINAEFASSTDYKIAVDADTGKLIVTYKGSYKISGDRQSFTPEVNSADGTVAWECTSTLRRKYRATGCKSYGK